MTDTAKTSERLPTIRRYLLQRIVGIIVFSFLIFAAAAWLIVLRPAQVELARVEMGRAADQVEGHINGLTDQIERMLVTARDWGRGGAIQIARPDEFARLMIPLLNSRPQLSQVLLANERGEAVFLGREASGWLLRVIDPAQDTRPALVPSRWVILCTGSSPSGNRVSGAKRSSIGKWCFWRFTASIGSIFSASHACTLARCSNPYPPAGSRPAQDRAAGPKSYSVPAPIRACRWWPGSHGLPPPASSQCPLPLARCSFAQSPRPTAA